MQLDYQNDINFDGDGSTISILQQIINSLGTPVDENVFRKELESYDRYKVEQTSKKLVNLCNQTALETMGELVADITATVVKVNDDGTINVLKPNDIDINQSWNDIPNPTIYTNLKVGDQVLLKCMKKEQKSNMWVVGAMISPDDFESRTIFKNILSIFNVSVNIEILKKWMDIIKRSVVQNG